MTYRMVGVGSPYGLIDKDRDSDYLVGDRPYCLTIPPTRPPGTSGPSSSTNPGWRSPADPLSRRA
jgi:hypothetical protein